MIVKMKKVALICLSREAEKVLARLRTLGVLHVEHQQAPQGADIVRLTDDMALVAEALAVLSEKEFSGPLGHEKRKILDDQGGSLGDDWRFEARYLIDARKRLEQLEEYSRYLKNRIAEAQPWGDFDPAAIAALAAKGVFVRLFEIPEKEKKNFSPDVLVRVISASGGSARCVVVSREKIDIPFKEVALPRMSLTEMDQRLLADKKAIADISEDIRKRARCREALVRVRGDVEKELEFYQACRGMSQAGELAVLGGYIPVDAQKLLLQASSQEKWGILITEPSAEDLIPTLVRNPKWVSVIQPLLKLLEVLPGYTELDISPIFLIFFSLFFGILIGDAGYGLMYFLITFFAQRKFGAKMQDKKIFFLMYILSFCAITWGFLTGTFFGQAWIAAGGIKALVPALNDPAFIQGVCFFIGVTHLSLAHAWRFIVQLPALTALAELGWISILWAAFLLIKMLLLGALFPPFGKFLIIGGIALVVFFSSPRKNIFATIGAGLGALALSLMNSFGDIVSYVRLFAVGLAGVAISDAFNSMASGAAASGVFGIIAAGLILVAGHALNFILSPMSVLVHGVRLNVLEFSGHAGVTWSGVSYKPLAEK
jgi:V/A-type H+-transporting ATPase subunit I